MSDLKAIIEAAKIKDDIASMNIYGDIVGSEWDCWSEEDVCPGFVSKFLADTKDKELHIHINSGGGSAFAGVAIYNLLKAREGRTVTYVDALAASAASVIALAGDTMVMPTGSMLMIHKPWCFAAGNSDDLRKEADSLDKIGGSLMEIYKENLVNSEDFERVQEMVNNETWLSAEECAELFKNAFVDNSLKACACVRGESMKRYKLPKGLQVKEKVEKPDLKRLEMELEIEEMLLN